MPTFITLQQVFAYGKEKPQGLPCGLRLINGTLKTTWKVFVLRNLMIAPVLMMATPVMAEESRRIVVNGHGVVETDPDLATVSMGGVSQAKTAGAGGSIETTGCGRNRRAGYPDGQSVPVAVLGQPI